MGCFATDVRWVCPKYSSLCPSHRSHGPWSCYSSNTFTANAGSFEFPRYRRETIILPYFTIHFGGLISVMHARRPATGISTLRMGVAAQLITIYAKMACFLFDELSINMVIFHSELLTSG